MSREVWSVSAMPAASTPQLIRDEVAEAAALLGEHHALVRILRIRRALRDQALMTLLVLIATVGLFFLDQPLGAAAAGVGVFVEGALVIASVLCRQAERERCWDVIIERGGPVPVRAVAREQTRLIAPTERDRLARSIERLLNVARRWPSILPAHRPPAAYRRLADTVTEAEQVVLDLRSARAEVTGVALAARLLAGGPDSVLSQGSTGELRAELRRVHSHFQQ